MPADESGITPDVPRPAAHSGPRSVFLASALRLPLVALGFGYDRPWRMKNWDQFAIPAPARAAERFPARNLDSAALGSRRHRALSPQGGNAFESANGGGEAWAESGTRKVDEQPIRRGPGRRLAARVAGADDVPQSRPQPEPELEKRFELHPAA